MLLAASSTTLTIIRNQYVRLTHHLQAETTLPINGPSVLLREHLY